MTIIDAALEVAGHFEALGVRYVLGGSLAASVHGEPRATRDVDIAAELLEEHAPSLVTRLGERWYADETAILEAIRRRSSFNLLRRVDIIKVDVFVPPDTGFHPGKWARARWMPLAGADAKPVAVTDPESLILQKLDGFRRGGEVSDNPWRDVLGIARAGLLDLWHRVREELRSEDSDPNST